jgi:hypothetical protein
MAPIVVALLALLLMLAGAAAGAFLRHFVPDDHLDTPTKDIVRLGAGLVATITALVLGLLVNSSHSFYEIQRSDIRRVASDVILLDTVLDNYGPVATDTRRLLRRSMKGFVEQVWNDELTPMATTPFGTLAHDLFNEVANLPSATPLERTLHDQGVAALIRIAQSRLDLYERSRAHLPKLMLYVLMFWLTALFASFSLFSPLNPSAVAVVAVFSTCAAGAFFLIFEMYEPFEGLMQIDRTPLLNALAPLGG